MNRSLALGIALCLATVVAGCTSEPPTPPPATQADLGTPPPAGKTPKGGKAPQTGTPPSSDMVRD